MDQAGASSSDAVYDIHDDITAPYRLNLNSRITTPDNVQDSDLPSLTFQPEELGDLLLFPEISQLQEPSSWDLENFGYTYERPLIRPDGRMEGGQYPPEYYAYSPPRLDIWDDGLQAIEEFDWSTPETATDNTARTLPWAADPKTSTVTEQRDLYYSLADSQLEQDRADVQAKTSQAGLGAFNKGQQSYGRLHLGSGSASPPWIASPPRTQTQHSTSVRPDLPADAENLDKDDAREDAPTTTTGVAETNLQPEDISDTTMVDLDTVAEPGPISDNASVLSADADEKGASFKSSDTTPEDGHSTKDASKALAQPIEDATAQREAYDTVPMLLSTSDQQQAGAEPDPAELGVENILPAVVEDTLSILDEDEVMNKNSNQDVLVSGTNPEPAEVVSDDSEKLQDEYSEDHSEKLYSALYASEQLETSTTQEANEESAASNAPALLPKASSPHKRSRPTKAANITSSDTEREAPARKKNKEESRLETNTSKLEHSKEPAKRLTALKSPKESSKTVSEEIVEEIMQNETVVPKVAQKKKKLEPSTKAAAPKQPEPHVEEDIQSGDDDAPAGLHRDEQDVEPPVDDDDYDMQEHFTDVQNTPAHSSEQSFTPNRPPKNHVSNRELAALSSNLTPGMYIGHHDSQPKRARKSTGRSANPAYVDDTVNIEDEDEEEESEPEVIPVKKKRTAPTSKKTPVPKKPKLETPKSTSHLRANRGIKTEQRSFADAEDTEQDQDHSTPPPSTEPMSQDQDDADQQPKVAKRKSLLKTTLAATPPVKNKYGFSPRKTRSRATPAKPKTAAKGKGEAKNGDGTRDKRRGSTVEMSDGPVTRRASLAQEKETNIGKRLRSGD